MRAHPKAYIPTLKPSSIQDPTSSRARHYTNSPATQEHSPKLQYTGCPKSHETHRHLKTHYWTFHCTPERRNPALPARTPMQASLTRKPWQATRPTPLIGRNLHKKRGTTNCQNTERPPQTQQSKQDERQRNTQQVKEHDKSPSNQTKEEEEIGSLPEKKFRIMIVKMIQNLENKMELQINSLETRIEKMQERFNKDLEKIKKSQSIMNNAINEIRNTPEGANSRIMEAEDRIVR